MPYIVWDVFTSPCPGDLLLTHYSSFDISRIKNLLTKRGKCRMYMNACGKDCSFIRNIVNLFIPPVVSSFENIARYVLPGDFNPRLELNTLMITRITKFFRNCHYLSSAAKPAALYRNDRFWIQPDPIHYNADVISTWKFIRTQSASQNSIMLLNSDLIIINRFTWENTDNEVIEWKQFPHYWPIFDGNSPVTGSPHNSQWSGALMCSLFCAWANGWVHSRDAGDLRRHCAHCDVTVITVGARTVALDIIARCAITQTPTRQSKVWWWHAQKMVVIFLKRI